MKIRYTTIALLFAAAASGYCENYVVNGGSPRGAIPVGTNNDTLTLNSEGGDGYVVNAATTFKSVSAINGASAGNVGVYGANFTIDINSASGNVDALTANNFFLFNEDVYITNSAAASTATANITLNKLDVYTLSNQYVQNQRIAFENVTANVTASSNVSTFGNDSLPTTGYHTAELNINSGANVTWNGNLKFAGYGSFNLNGGHFTHYGNVELGAPTAKNLGGKMNINSGAVYEIGSGSITMGAGTTLNIAGTLITSSTLEFTGGGYIYSTGTINQSAGNLEIKNANVSLSGSARWNIGARLDVGTPSGNASLTIGDSSKILMTTGGRVLLISSNAYFDLMSNDSIVGYENDAERYIAAVVTGTNNVMHVYNDQHFMYFNFLAGGTMDIQVHGDARFYLTDSYTAFNFGDENASLRILDFKEGQIYVGNGTAAKDRIEQHVTLYDEYETLLGTATVVDGWISLASVPEPAEWAMALGAAALCAVFWLRRKR